MNKSANTATSDSKLPIPRTPRGRALYTVSWYLHGRLPKQSFDIQQAGIKDIRHGSNMHADAI